MQIHSFNSHTLQLIEKIHVESLSFDPIEMSFSIPGGGLLVRVLSEVKPSLVIMMDSRCNLHFKSTTDATEFGRELRTAQEIAARRNESRLD
jgi:hypothetical protein